MKLLLNYLLCLLIGILLFSSCQKDNSQEKLLHQAYNNLATGKADVALNILSSIQNPQEMDKNSYMQFIVTYVGAKYETKQDIKADTLILEAQRYFNEKEKSQYTPLANYYAAQLHDESGNFPKALESYLYAANSNNKLNNSLVVSKSLNNIGYIYYRQDLLDDAIIYFQEALSYYDNVKTIDQRKLKILTNIGRSFEESNSLDSAAIYYNKVLDQSLETDNEKYQSYSLQNLGIVYFNKGEYDKAIDYFQKALALKATEEVEAIKINLFLLNIYNKNQDTQSAKDYANLIISYLSKVNYIYTLKGMYGALADHFQQLGDYKQALEYRNLELTTKEQIEKERNTPALLDADKNFHLVLKEKEVQKLRADIALSLIIGVSVFCIILAFMFFIWKNYKKNQAEIRACTDKYDILKGMLYSMSDQYPKIESEIKSMLEDD